MYVVKQQYLGTSHLLCLATRVCPSVVWQSAALWSGGEMEVRRLHCALLVMVIEHYDPRCQSLCSCTYIVTSGYYRIAGKFGEEFILVNW